MKKVLMVLHDDDTYGAPKSVIKLAELIKIKFGVEAIILTPKKNKVNALCDQLGIENLAIRNWRYFVHRKRYFFEPFVNFCLNKFYDLTFYKKIEKAINFDEIDLIHSAVSVVSHGHELAKKYHKPHIWHLRELDPYQHYFTKNQLVEMSMETDRFIAISEVVKSFWTELGLSSEKVSVVYNGIEPLENSRPPKDTEQKIKLVFSGRISPSKQIETIIDAMGLLNQNQRERISLDIYGTATKIFQKYEQSLRKSVIEQGLTEQVHFKGYEDKITAKLAHYDVAIMSSKAEAFGRTTVEYMFAGLCVLATNTGANPEIIEDERTGFIYANGDSEELKKLIERVLLDPSIINEVGKNAKASAEEKFTAEANATNVYRVYQEVLNEY